MDSSNNSTYEYPIATAIASVASLIIFGGCFYWCVRRAKAKRHNQAQSAVNYPAVVGQPTEIQQGNNSAYPVVSFTSRADQPTSVGDIADISIPHQQDEINNYNQLPFNPNFNRNSTNLANVFGPTAPPGVISHQQTTTSDDLPPTYHEVVSKPPSDYLK